MPTRTRFVLLMHPKEFKREKAGTGRLTHLCLPNSRIIMGAAFHQDPALNECIADDRYRSVLLYPGREAQDLSDSCTAIAPPDRPLQVFILDATWASARKMLRLSPDLQRLPRIMFTPTAPSRYLIKQQPQAGCLSTLEAVHEMLTLLARAGRDDYAQPGQLLSLFARMQDYQMQCAADPTRGGYRRQPYQHPAERAPTSGSSRKRRQYLRLS
jgi:DTW domain-containing protein YfiP